MSSSLNSVPSRHFALEQLAPGVFAAIASPAGGAMANAGVVDLGGQSLVIDTFMYPSAAQDLAAAAEAVTGRPIGLVVNTHADRDHVFGNQVFASAQIYATDVARARFAAIPVELEELCAGLERALPEATGAERAAKAERLAEFRTVVPTPPNRTFDSRLTLWGAEREVQLITWGGGHTASDAVVWLPAERILFTGDLVTVGHHPYLENGNAAEWLTILDQAALLPAERVVPGHGPVGSMADLHAVRDYLAGLLATVEEARRAGLSADEVAQTPVPAQFAAWEWSMLYGINLRFLYER